MLIHYIQHEGKISPYVLPMVQRYSISSVSNKRYPSKNTWGTIHFEPPYKRALICIT